MSKLTKGYGSTGLQAILGDMKTYYEGELAKKANTSDIPDITGKADKVTNATSGHLAGLDSNGNLTDSGVSPTEDVTVEGNPVTFDSPFEQDAKSVVVSVKPIQDLHGYDYPWVGGAGKNKFATSFTQVNTQYIECDEFVVPARGYVFKFKNISSSAIAFWASDSSDITDTTIHIVDAGQTANVTYTVGSGGKVKFEMRYNPSAEGITPSSISEVALYLSNDVPASFEPYSNICPISGIDELEIGVSGKNHVKGCYKGYPNAAINSFSIDNDSESGVFYAIEGQTYVVSSSVALNRCVMAYTDTPDLTGGLPISNITNLGDNTRTWTATWTGWTIWYVYAASSADVEASLQIELGSTPTEFEPYVSHTTIIPLPSTLYGGTVDVTNGDADSRYGFVQTTWGDMTNPQDRGDYTIKNIPNLNCKSTGDAVGNLCNLTDNEVANFDQNVHYWCQKNVGALVSLPSDTPNDTVIQICYELATPTTLSLTPTDVELLEGTNVVSTNAEKVAVTYKAGILATLGDIDDLNDKVKTKFDKANVATIEPRNTASKTYYKGDYIVRSDGCLYDVTATIASGAAFTNNNTHKTNLGDELNKFKVYVATDNSPVNGNDVASVSISGYLPISPFQVFSWTGSGTVSITPKSSGGTWNVSGDVSNVRYGQIFMRT